MRFDNIPDKMYLQIICPTHGKDPLPYQCQTIRQYTHKNCGGGICFVHIKNGNLSCSGCPTLSHISNFKFFCEATCSYESFKKFQGAVVMNLFNQYIGKLSDEEAYYARSLFKSLWNLDY